MFTVKSVSTGLALVLALYVVMFLYRAFAGVSSTRTTGMAVLLPNLTSIMTSPAFWVLAILVFFVTVFRVGRGALPHS